jgi:hypothetical protein
MIIFFEPDSRMLSAFKAIIPRKMKLRAIDEQYSGQGD